MASHSPASSFGQLVQGFFVERLQQQRGVSAQTLASYRDTFRLFLQFAQRHTRKLPVQLTLSDLDAPLLLAFLRHLETERHNSVRTRNARLAALRSFLKYAALNDIAAMASLQRALAIPMKRFDKPLIGFLTRQEMQALLDAPPSDTWIGQRDRVLLATLYNTGARASEIINARVSDVVLSGSPSLYIFGKGRKERNVPLWPGTARQIRTWLHQLDEAPQMRLFPNRSGQPMTRSNLTDRLKHAVRIAQEQCPQLRTRRISPHSVRHSIAMHLLQSGVEITVIALWLGHESPSTTHTYIEADLTMKEHALRSLQPPQIKQSRYRPTDRLLQFLEGL